MTLDDLEQLADETGAEVDVDNVAGTVTLHPPRTRKWDFNGIHDIAYLAGQFGIPRPMKVENRFQGTRMCYVWHTDQVANGGGTDDH